MRALQPVPPPSGTGVAGYQVADYLDQHGRRTRQDQLGPASLWDALTAHAASASDLTRLGQAARDRGLYRHAAALWTTAATLGSADAARQLITHLRRVSPGDTTRAAQWAVGHASLDDPRAVALLLRALREAGASDAVTALLARDPAGHASLDDPEAVAVLLRELGEAGAGDAVTALADPGRRPRQPRRPGGRRRAAAGAARGRGQRRGHRPAGPRPRRPRQPRRPAGRRRAAAGAARGRGQRRGHRPGWPATPPPTPASTTRGPSPSCCGSWARPGPATRSPPWPARDPAGHASLDDPWAVAELLRALGEAGASDAVTALLARGPPPTPASTTRGPSPCCCGRWARPGPATRSPPWLTRAAGHASLDDPGAVAELLRALRGPGPATRSPPCWPATPPATPASTTRGPSPSCCGRWARPGPATRSPPWPPGPPATPASTTRGPSPCCCGRCARPGPATRSPPWLARAAGHASLDDPGAVAELLRALRAAGASDAVTALAGPGRRPRQPRRPGGRRRAAAGAARGRGQRRGHCPAGPRPRRPRQPRQPAGRRRAAAGAARGRGQRRGHRPGWPAAPPATPASTTRGPSPSCWGRCARPGPATRSPPWPTGPPTRACSIFSSRFVLTRPPATGSGASQTEPHRNPGDGKSRAPWSANKMLNGAEGSAGGGLRGHCGCRWARMITVRVVASRGRRRADAGCLRSQVRTM